MPPKKNKLSRSNPKTKTTPPTIAKAKKNAKRKSTTDTLPIASRTRSHDYGSSRTRSLVDRDGGLPKRPANESEAGPAPKKSKATSESETSKLPWKVIKSAAIPFPKDTDSGQDIALLNASEAALEKAKKPAALNEANKRAIANRQKLKVSMCFLYSTVERRKGPNPMASV